MFTTILVATLCAYHCDDYILDTFDSMQECEATVAMMTVKQYDDLTTTLSCERK